MAIGPGHPTFAFTADSVSANAPEASGVYAICTIQGKYVYFGETNDIRRRLLQHLYDSRHCMHQNGAGSFAYEIGSPLERVLRQNQLVRVHATPCNEGLG